MKKLVIVVAVLVTSMTFAQSISDALRLGNANVTGTARYRAMGGAFGALGGDLSAIGINPASSAIFKRSTASFTIANDNYDNQTNYFGTSNSLSDSDLSFNQVGGVLIIEGASNSKWNKISLGFNYDQTGNFDDEFFASGVGNTSISSYFTDLAQGVPLNLLETLEGESVAELYQFLGEEEGYAAQQALLGFQSFLIDPVDFDNPDNTSYLANTGGAAFQQEYAFASSGYNGKGSFNVGAQYNDNLFLGVNLNSHFMDYTQSSIYFESTDALSDGLISVQDVRFENNLRTIASGFSFQLGTIAKVNKEVRVGFTYDSPTWYTISEEGSQNIRTTAVDIDGEFTTTVNPQVVNVFQDYEVKTPEKYTGSIAYLFGKQGLISFDYSYTDYTNLSFRPQTDAFFQLQNTVIENALQAASTYKLGAELRSDEWSFRGGYRLEESPYKDETTVGELTGYSFGVGYNFGNTKLDLAYDRYEQDRNQSLFSTGLTSATAINKTNTAIVATLTFSL